MAKEMIQGESDWKEWRRQGIGSSDAAVIMGISPWKTPLQLYEEKVTPSPNEQTSWAMQRGHDLEPLARAQYELLNELDMPPKLFVHPEYSFLRASLDGYNEEKKIVLEIKCPGKEDHKEAAENQRVPEKYWPQLQHQLLVTGARLVHYFSFDGISGVLIEVHPEPEYLKTLLEMERAFWKLVEKKTPPPPSDRDYIVEKDFVNLANMAEWKHKQRQIKILEKDCDELREHILGRIKHPRVRGNGVRIQKITKRGNVDYAQVPALAGIDLDQWRKPATEYYSFGIEKE